MSLFSKKQKKKMKDHAHIGHDPLIESVTNCDKSIH